MYVLKVMTWENDADNRVWGETRTKDRDHVELLVRIAHLFKSQNRGEGLAFGNSEVVVGADCNVDLADAIDAIVADMRGQGKKILKTWDRAEDPEFSEEEFFYMDSLYDFIGTWADGEYWRVFERFTVEIIENPIDVTDQFKL